jgi:hypothetical protein
LTPFRHTSRADPEENRGSGRRIRFCREDLFQLARQDVSDHLPTSSKVVPLLRPGTFVTLENQPADLPPFQLIQCRGGRCWVRQQAWGQYVHWEVEHERLRAA